MTRTVFLAAVAAGLLLNALPVEAATASTTGQTATQAAPNNGKTYLTPEERAKRTDARIKELHDKLGITGAQEARWAEVAKTMRDNEATISALIEERHREAQTMDALDDLQSYADITQAHADGIKKMIAAFEPLYDEMPGEQKKNADTVFNSFQGRGIKQDKARK